MTPLTIGKPEPHLFELAAEAVGRSPRGRHRRSATASVTDLAGAKAIGARSVLMLTGIATPARSMPLPPEERPDAVAADAEELAAALEAFEA